MNERNDQFAELMTWSNPAQLCPLPLQRSMTDSMHGQRKQPCGTGNAQQVVAFDTAVIDARRRYNTFEDTNQIANNCVSKSIAQSSPHAQTLPHRDKNIVTPGVILDDSTSSCYDNLLIFENETRQRTSTLESVMAVKSVYSVKNNGDDGTLHIQYNSTNNTGAASTHSLDNEWEINDSKSDVSSLSDYEHHHDSKSPTSRVGNTITSIFKRPIVRPLRLRSEATQSTAATTAMHTLETIDNFDVPSHFSPLGALSGKEELSFLASAKNKVGKEQYGSLHGYHRRCRTVHHVDTAPVRHVRNHSDQNVGIQSSWLLSTPKESEQDLIDMEHEIDMNVNPSAPLTVMSSASTVASITSMTSSPLKSIANVTTMSTGEDHSQQSNILTRPPIVARAKTSPALFNDMRSHRINPAFLRKRPQILTTAPMDSPCMIRSTIAEAISPKAVSCPRRPSSTNCSVSISINTRDGVSLPSLEEDDENASFGSFDEEFHRKDKVKMIGREVKQLFKNLDPKPAVKIGKRLLGLSINEHELKRAEGCLT